MNQDRGNTIICVMFYRNLVSPTYSNSDWDVSGTGDGWVHAVTWIKGQTMNNTAFKIFICIFIDEEVVES